MDMWIWIVLAVLLVAIVGAGIAAIGMRATEKRRSEELQGSFGPEYDAAVGEYGSKKKAEQALRGRQERVEGLKLRALTAEQRSRFASTWKDAQAEFVDEPTGAIQHASKLVDEAMSARGYPVGDFDQRAADISVDHPYVVQNYRSARDIAKRNDAGEANTEDLRQAMVHYRGLFEELVNAPGDVPAIEAGRDQGAPREGQGQPAARPSS